MKDPEDFRLKDPVVPFEEHQELIDGLEYVPAEHTLRALAGGSSDFLPGQPRIALTDSAGLVDYCTQDLSSPGFANLSSWMGIFPSSTPILALTAQLVRGRQVLITEEATLHCFWDEKRYFVKPLPPYLLSHAFWTFLVDEENPWLTARQRHDLILSAKGILHTYTKLIQHESDYILALQMHLIQVMTPFPDLVRFLRPFTDLPDAPQSRRFVGEYQLLTVNRISFFKSARPYYRLHQYQYNAFFAPYFAPMLFIFATFSVCLSAMQVALAVRQGEAPVEGTTEGGLDNDWKLMGYAFRWFSIATLTFAGGFSFFFLLMFYGLLLWDLKARAKEARRRRKKAIREKNP
jgi:uncharacterized membrane protein